MIKVIHFVQGNPTLKEINENSLEELQSLVGGHIETYTMPNEAICVCNEDGKLRGLYANIRIGSEIIHGDCFICRANEEEFASVTDKDIEQLM